MESKNPEIIPRKDSNSSVISSDKMNSQTTVPGESKVLKKSSLPPDGGFQVKHSYFYITFLLGLNIMAF